MAQVDYFLKIDGVDGESGDDKHKGEIEVESFSWGETQVRHGRARARRRRRQGRGAGLPFRQEDGQGFARALHRLRDRRSTSRPPS